MDSLALHPLAVQEVIKEMTTTMSNVAILGFAMSFFVFNTIYFVKKEEPQMKERFADYEDYYDAVPRWIPRLTPYKQKE